MGEKSVPGSRVLDCGYKHYWLPQQSCSEATVNLSRGTQEAGLTRHVQILSPLYSESSQAAKNTQRPAWSGTEQGTPFSPQPPCLLPEEGPDKAVGMVGPEVNSTNVRGRDACLCARDAEGLPYIEGTETEVRAQHGLWSRRDLGSSPYSVNYTNLYGCVPKVCGFVSLSFPICKMELITLTCGLQALKITYGMPLAQTRPLT